MALINSFSDEYCVDSYSSYDNYVTSYKESKAAEENINNALNKEIRDFRDFLEYTQSVSTFKVDSKWYIKINKSLGVSEVKIKDITEKTVLLEFLNNCVPRSVRYALSDIEFIEEIK